MRNKKRHEILEIVGIALVLAATSITALLALLQSLWLSWPAVRRHVKRRHGIFKRWWK